MPRSHPPTLLKIAKKSLVEECGASRGDRVLAAVSGGPDSQALLDVLAKLAPRLGFDVFAHGVDHGLRATASAELDIAARLAASLDVPFSCSKLSVAAGGNLQARARDARYRALERARERLGATFIATAHHADDRAETVLIRLMSGSGPHGLGVLPARDGHRIRPLVRSRKSDISAHVQRHRLEFAVDPSNDDRRYLRARVRLEVLPLLEHVSTGIVDHLNALADELLADRAVVVEDERGRPIALARAHLAEIRRALQLRRPTTVRIGGGRQVRVEPKTGRLSAEPAPPISKKARSLAAGGRSRPGAKSR